MHKKQRETFENNSKCITALHRCTQYFVWLCKFMKNTA